MEQDIIPGTPEKSLHVNKPLFGIMFMVLGIGSLTAMDALAKTLVQQNFNPLQILGLRFFIIVPVILGYYLMTSRFSELIPTRPRFQIIRGCLGFFAPFCFFFSLKYLPLSDAIVTSYSSIMMITIISHFVLKEKIGLHRWGAVVVGFMGVYVAMSPSGEGQLLGYAMVLCAALSYSILVITGRILTRTETVGSMVLVFNCCTGGIALCFMPLVWQAVDVDTMMLIIALSLLALAGHICLVMAFTRAQASLVAPFEYTSLIWAVLIEWSVWQYLPAHRTLVGAVIIIVAGTYVIYREHLRGVR